MHNLPRDIAIRPLGEKYITVMHNSRLAEFRRPLGSFYITRGHSAAFTSHQERGARGPALQSPIDAL
jgi:hypothetical protein